MSELLTESMFSQSLNSTFHIKSGDASGPVLDLVEVRNGIASPNVESFSLLFRGSRSNILQQMTYEMEHPSLGRFSLFLVPIGQDENGTYYESVFNRFIVDRA